MKRQLAYIFILMSLNGYSQKLHEITLGLEKLETPLNYNVIKIIDGRGDKSSIGWVQKSIANVKKPAILNRGVEREINELLRKSRVMNSGGDSVIIRIEYLSITEQTRAASETAKAEITLDAFYIHDDSAWFVDRKHASQEMRGMEVTHKHPKNIVNTLDQILAGFNSLKFNVDPNRSPVAISDIASFKLIEREDLEAAPVFSGTQPPPDGLFSTFDDFYQNKPNITSGYEVEPGKVIKVKWIKDDGTRRKVKGNVYALSHSGILYIHFNNNFYPIEKREKGLFFVGPVVPDSGAMLAGGLLGGIIGSTIAASTSGHQNLYRIDLSNGALKVEQTLK